MKRMRIILLSILLGCSLYAKSSNQDTPEWLDDPGSKYPENMYLTVVGEGDSRKAAENDATGKMSRIFEAKIKVESTYLERYIELTKDNSSSSSSVSTSDNTVAVQSDQTLFNLKFSDSYTDVRGRVHVLGYINRFETASIYEDKISDNSEQIIFFIEQALAASDPIEKYANYSAATTVDQNNKVLMEQLGIISLTTKEMLEINYDSNQLMKDFIESARAISFSVNISNDTDNKLKKMVEALLTDLGFSLQKDALLYLDGEIDFENMDLPRKEKFVRWELNIKITDRNSNVIFSLNKSNREGHVSYAEARARGYREIEKEFNNKLKRSLLSYFDSLVTSKKK
ncbi:MAG: LPP20 family lipoprotein [Candidatus Cloacimonetes bacterium]|nr:LPP20 family lipoprotein [Candidatus Cloacimonadota bacterium]